MYEFSSWVGKKEKVNVETAENLTGLKDRFANSVVAWIAAVSLGKLMADAKMKKGLQENGSFDLHIEIKEK